MDAQFPTIGHLHNKESENSIAWFHSSRKTRETNDLTLFEAEGLENPQRLLGQVSGPKGQKPKIWTLTGRRRKVTHSDGRE